MKLEQIQGLVLTQEGRIETPTLYRVRCAQIGCEYHGYLTVEEQRSATEPYKCPEHEKKDFPESVWGAPLPPDETRARVEYTVEDRRGNPVRRAKECRADQVERTIDKLVDRGAFNFDVRYEVQP